MSDPISRRPLPVLPKTRPQTGAAAAGPQPQSTRNPLRRIIRWAKSTKLGRAFSRLFARRTRSAPPAASAARTTRLQSRRAAAAPSGSQSQSGLPARRAPRAPLPDLPAGAAAPAEQTAFAARPAASRLAPQTVLAGALHEIGEWGKQAQLSDAQRDFLQEAWRDLAALAVRRTGLSAQEVCYALGNLSLNINMPEELGAQLRSQYRPLSGAGQTAASAAPHARFLQEVDRALALQLVEAPAAEALQASALVAQHVRRHMQEFYALGPDGEGAETLPELQAFLQKLARDMKHGAASLLSSQPGVLKDVVAFLRAPTYRNFLAMLDKTENGYDMMKHAWLLSQTEFAPEQSERHWQSYSSKRRMQAAADPFSFLQQSEFCAQHFQTRLLPPAYDVTDTPGAEMASALFVGERLAQQAGRADLRGEHFAQGHMLWLALTEKQSLADSLAIMRAVRIDARPVAAFTRDESENVWRPTPTAQSAAVLARQTEILDEPLPSHDALSAAADEPGLSAALQEGWPAAVAAASAQWRG